MRLTAFPGAAYVETSHHRILFGTFSEVHQQLQNAGLPFPDVVVCGDRRVQAGVPQLVPEFLFFGYLFLEKRFDFQERTVAEPLTVVGTSEQCAAVRDIMDVSYLGAMPHLLAETPLDTQGMLLREGEYFALKDHSGKVIPLDAYFRFLTWQDGRLKLDGLLVEKLSGTRFRVREGDRETVVDISFEGAQDPVWPLPVVQGVQTLPPFSLRVLGAAGPFQTEAPSSSYLLTLNARYYLIDCAPFTHRILERLGIAAEDIAGIILTHVHDDHSGGLLAFMEQNEKIELLTTREIYAAARVKLAAILGEPEAGIDRRLRFRPVDVREPLFLDGATISFHYASHSIPTIGVTVAVEGEKITLTGDTAGHRTLREMLEQGVISPERFDRLTGLSRENKVLVDCGEALIHGYPQDFLQVPDTRNVILAHRKDLPPEYQGIFTLAHSLQFFPLKSSDPVVFDTACLGKWLTSWSVPDPWNWASLLASDRRVIQAVEPTVCLITHGLIDLFLADQWVGRLQAGDLCGEAGLLEADLPETRLVPRSPVRMLALSPKTVRRLLEEEPAMREGLSRLWAKRKLVSRIRFFAEGRNALPIEKIDFEPGMRLAGPPACYLVSAGVFLLEDGEERILKPNTLFGNFEGFLESRGGLSLGERQVRALERSTLLSLSAHDLFRLGGESPWLHAALAEARQEV